MARNVHVNTITGPFFDGTDLIQTLRQTLSDDLSAVGITGTGLPVISVLSFNGTCDIPLSIKLSDTSKIAAIPYNGTMYSLDMGTYSDNMYTPINTMTLMTDTPSASSDLRLNCFFVALNT